MLALLLFSSCWAATAIGQDAPADEIQFKSVAKPDEARKKARDRPRRVLFNNDGGEPVVEMKSPTAQEFFDRRRLVR